MRFKTGVVVGTKMAKTVTVLVDGLKAHPKYKKQYKVSKKFYAHNESAEIKLGDVVTIVETRPLSKLKRWRVVSEKEQKALLAENNKAGKSTDDQFESHKKQFLLDYKKRTKKAKAADEKPAAAEATESSPAS